jgi:ribosomal protein S17E
MSTKNKILKQIRDDIISKNKLSLEFDKVKLIVKDCFIEPSRYKKTVNMITGLIIKKLRNANSKTDN